MMKSTIAIRLLFLTAACILVLTACTTSAPGTRMPPPVPTVDRTRKLQADPVGQTVNSAPVRPSAGCGQQPKTLIGATSTVKLNVNGKDRVYLVHIPTNYDPNVPTSLVLSIHGYTDSAGGMESGTGMSYHADKYNYIVIYPMATNFKSQGKLITSWNDLTCNASPGPAGPICSANHTQYAVPSDCGPEVTKDSCNWCTCNNDLGYINKVLDEAEANLCVDLNRVYATGMSNGGMFTNRLGCNLADRFAAIGPVSGTLAKGFNCAPDSSEQISILYIHGREDDYVDVTGKESTDGYFYTPVNDVMALWASTSSQNCSDEETPYPTIADGISGFSCTQHAGCSNDSEVVSCWWDAGHAWPGGSSPWGNDVIWDFFLKHAKNINP
jgi:polyhydroxybutyrate depolymerase